MHPTGSGPTGAKIAANGIVTGNTVIRFFPHPRLGRGDCRQCGRDRELVSGNRFGIFICEGSTWIGNTAFGQDLGIDVSCRANVTDNTTSRLVLNGNGCNDTDNLGSVASESE